MAKLWKTSTQQHVWPSYGKPAHSNVYGQAMENHTATCMAKLWKTSTQQHVWPSYGKLAHSNMYGQAMENQHTATCMAKLWKTSTQQRVWPSYGKPHSNVYGQAMENQHTATCMAKLWKTSTQQHVWPSYGKPAQGGIYVKLSELLSEPVATVLYYPAVVLLSVREKLYSPVENFYHTAVYIQATVTVVAYW